jgi:prepilin-type processing-associated H-X9-DG protein
VGDHDSTFAPNPDGAGNPPYGESAARPAWVAGQMSTGAGSDNTNTDKLVGSLYSDFGSLGPYTRSPGVYHCPADKTAGPGQDSRVRSYSQNGYVAPHTANDGISGISYNMTQRGCEFYVKDTDFRKLKPTDGILFIEERYDSLNDGFFWSPDPKPPLTILDMPQFAHGGSVTVFSFADGHVETHKWLTTFFKTASSRDSVTGNADMNWFVAHCTSQ